jgi:hypothetical protein
MRTNQQSRNIDEILADDTSEVDIKAVNVFLRAQSKERKN